MPDNTRMERCISEQQGALVFWAPDGDRGRLTSKAQIIDVFSLQVATGFVRDPQGRLLLQAQPSVAAGRTWSMARAVQLIRNDARPSRRVALQLDRRAWGLFWSGGGLQRCRTLLVDRLTDSEASSALVPATPETLLRLLVDLGSDRQGPVNDHVHQQPDAVSHGNPAQINPWMILALTSLAWIVVLGICVAGFMQALDRQDRKLELLLQRTQSPPETTSPAAGRP